MGEVVEIVASTVTRTLGDGIIVGIVVLTLWGAVGEEVTTEGGTAALQIATATEITHEIEPCEFQTAEIGVTASTIHQEVPENIGDVYIAPAKSGGASLRHEDLG